ncbi:MAG: MBL fold metallo-hydrolase [bacterium]|nr:MBL fold metallo-hydrolase [bacterium]
MSDSLRLSFHGAAGTVTGSRHLLHAGKTQVLLDAGLFQGLKKLRLRNWEDPGFEPWKIQHMLLSHTHIDHVGYLPRLAKLGLDAPVYCTPAAYELAELMLLDSAKIQEEDARHANRKGYTKHRPALPLYTAEDAQQALGLRRAQRYNQWLELDPKIKLRARFLNSGHILGSAFIEIRMEIGGREVRIVFSGDIGRHEMPLHLDPRPLPECDVLIMESTYGNRTHDPTPVIDQIREPFRVTLAGGGTILIPAFAVGRSQQMTLLLRRLMKNGELPDVPIHIDSPMAFKATRIYSRFLDRRNIDPEVYEDGRLKLFPDKVRLHRTVDESKELNNIRGPKIIISASGMLSGGRVLHHLKRLAPDPRNLLALVGYQAEGTRGRAIVDGKPSVKLHGRHVPIRCRSISIQGMSGHADGAGLLRWVASAPRPPKLAFMVHGTPKRAAALGDELRKRFPVRTFVPEIGDEFDLLSLLDGDEG